MNKYFKTLVWDLVVEAALQRLFLYVPLLGWGPIGMIVRGLAIRFADRLFVELHDNITDYKFKFRNEEHRLAFEKSMFVLHVIDNDPLVSEKEREDALKQARADLAKYVVYYAG